MDRKPGKKLSPAAKQAVAKILQMNPQDKERLLRLERSRRGMPIKKPSRLPDP
jgi:hypothetical protein